jgi:hypothetical protein
MIDEPDSLNQSNRVAIAWNDFREVMMLSAEQQT